LAAFWFGIFLKNVTAVNSKREIADVVQMDKKAYRVWFMVATLILMLWAASPTLPIFIRLPDVSEKFSELWLLGPSHEARDYPFNITVDEVYSLYVGVSNHLGYSAYYRILVKLRNQTQPFPTSFSASPSTLPTLYDFDFFVDANGFWEEMLHFRILNMTYSKDTMIIQSLSINEVSSQVYLSSWNNTGHGFRYQMFFELWLYNTTSSIFQYHNRFASLWLNMTD
jgi:hypothetical protein